MSHDGLRPGGQQIIPRPAGWSFGPPPAWEPDAAAGLGQLIDAVPDHDEPLRPAFAGARHSAVLLALSDGPEGPEVLLTRRSREMRTHSGEVSLPGGRIDPGETPSDTALREAHEEVGLDPRRVEIRGELHHLNTWASHSYIVPKVATVPERFDLSAQTIEVDRVLWVPLSELTRSDTYRAEVWPMHDGERTLHFFHLDDETIWGATARILVDLLERALPGVSPSGERR